MQFKLTHAVCVCLISPTDLKGQSACFPSFEGAAFASVVDSLQKLSLIESNCSHSLNDFFAKKSCLGQKNSKYCAEKYLGDFGAFNCLQDFGDVAFMSLETFQNLTGE